MAHYELSDDELLLKFSGLERVLGLRSGARIPLSQVEFAQVVDNPWAVVAGLRVGTGIPLVVLLGTMLRGDANDVVAIYGRRPAVMVNLRKGARWQRLIATVDEPDRVSAEIQAAADKARA